jgi:hypothetical protein
LERQVSDEAFYDLKLVFLLCGIVVLVVYQKVFLSELHLLELLRNVTLRSEIMSRSQIEHV